jgi:hypothetical protein
MSRLRPSLCSGLSLAALLTLPSLFPTHAPPAWAGKPAPSAPRWQDQAAKHDLSSAEIERLGKQKFVIAQESAKQVFSFYLGGDLPVFVTSDSLLNAFHVLFEESVVRLESANARRLPELLRFLWKKLEKADGRVTGKPALAADARKRARAVIGVALTLAGGNPAGADKALAALIRDEARRVTATSGWRKPEWLGPPDRGFGALDYSRYHPRGFYTRTPLLQRHFRAVSWLQSIPFRVGKDAELVAALMLGDCFHSDKEAKGPDAPKGWESLCSGYRAFLGTLDDWDLQSLAMTADRHLPLNLDGDGLGKVREALLDQAKRDGSGPQINDQLRLIPSDPREVAEVGFRILSAYRTPDGVLFQRTTDPRALARPFPSGLEVCALLGSSFAREHLSREKDGKKLLKIIEAARALHPAPRRYVERNLYALYLDCLESLVGPAEPDAPAFMSSEAWRIKNCQTALAGWAQLRHTWALQARQTVTYLSAGARPTAFVEPVPEFYACLQRMVTSTRAALDEQGAQRTGRLELAADIRAFLEVAVKNDLFKKQFSKKALEELTEGERMVIYNHDGLLWLRLGDLSADRIRKLAEQLERGRDLPKDEWLRKIVAAAEVKLGMLWENLEQLCGRLETLAHKQLRGVAFNQHENEFLKNYGSSLAGIMLYGGNSYHTPRDDAPRIVDVFSNPTRAHYLEVGIGRPRALYVLYPFKGKEILCRGAVLPYYEFTHSTRLDDARWKRLLDSRDRPEPPEWLRPVLSPTRPEKEKR